MASSNPTPDSNVCFAELIVRLDSLLTLRDDLRDDQEVPEDAVDEEEKLKDKQQLEFNIKQKLTELYLRLKNGGNTLDNSALEDEDDEDEAVEDTQGPISTSEGAVGSVDCVGCSSAEDENEVCPSPITPKGNFSNQLNIILTCRKYRYAPNFSNDTTNLAIPIFF